MCLDLYFFLYLYGYDGLPTCISVRHMYAHTHRDQKRISDPLDLVVSCHVPAWNKPASSGRATSAVNHEALPPASQF